MRPIPWHCCLLSWLTHVMPKKGKGKVGWAAAGLQIRGIVADISAAAQLSMEFPSVNNPYRFISPNKIYSENLDLYKAVFLPRTIPNWDLHTADRQPHLNTMELPVLCVRFGALHSVKYMQIFNIGSKPNMWPLRVVAWGLFCSPNWPANYCCTVGHQHIW